MNDTQYTIEVRNLTKAYGQAEPAIKDISLGFKKGEFVVLLGPSGVGKSTLLRCLNLLVEPTTGQVIFEGQDLGKLSKNKLLKARRRIGMVFQEFNLVNRMSVLMNVMCGRLSDLSFLRALTYNFPEADYERAVKALIWAGLDDLELHFRRADTLSGGQKQRVGIARAMVQEPHLILADEPIASLDVITRIHVMDLISDIAKREGLTVVMSLHQLDMAKQYADRIIALSDSRVSFDGPPSELTDEVVEKIFKKPIKTVEKESAIVKPMNTGAQPVVTGIETVGDGR